MIQNSLKNSIGKVVFQILAKIEMTQNKNRLFGRHFEMVHYLLQNYDFFIVHTYVVQISSRNSAGKVVFTVGSLGTPLGHQREWKYLGHLVLNQLLVSWRTLAYSCVNTPNVSFATHRIVAIELFFP